MTSDIWLGTTVADRFQLTRCLGVGAMGLVYEAEHLHLRKSFALKMVRKEYGQSSEFAKRFEREAMSLSKLDHPNCVKITDYGRTEGGELFMVTEFLDGVSLADYMENGLDDGVAFELTKQVLRGLAHAHGEGIIHRDIKPANIMIVSDPAGDPVAKLVDFGIARVVGPDGSKELTQSGTALGTPEFMAPEQSLDPAVDERADLYAVGMVLWRMLAKRSAFETEDLMELLTLKVSKDPPRLSEVSKASPSKGLDQLMQKALHRLPKERFQTAAEFLNAIESFERGDYAQHRALWNQRGFVVGAAVLLAVLVGLWLMVGPREFGPEPLVTFSLTTTGAKQQKKSIDEYSLYMSRVLEDEALDKKLRDALTDTQNLIRLNLCEKAVARVEGLADEFKILSGLQYAKGAASACAGDLQKAISAYESALQGDSRYQEDPRILRDLEQMLSQENVRDILIALLVNEVGSPAAGILVKCTTSKSKSFRDRCTRGLVAIGAKKKVPWAEVLALDFLQARDCQQKRELVKKMEELGGEKSLPFLRKEYARRKTVMGFLKAGYVNECVRKEMKAVISRLAAESP